MPRKSSTAKQRARDAARNGAKYTTALRTNNSQEPGNLTRRNAYVAISVADMVRTVGASAYAAETLRRQQAMFDSYVARTLASLVNTSGVAEMLARQEAAMGSMLPNAVTNMISTSGVTETLAKQRADIDSYLTRMLASIGRTATVSSQVVAAIEQAALPHEQAAETVDALDRAASRLGI